MSFEQLKKIANGERRNPLFIKEQFQTTGKSPKAK